MTITGPKIKTVASYEQRLNYIVDLCGNAESGHLGQFGGQRKGRKLFDTIDYEQIAKCAGESPITIFDAEFSPKGVIKPIGTSKDFNGPALTEGEIADVIIIAINEKEPDRRKGGLPERAVVVTTNHILFQIYLIKLASKAAAR